MTRLHIVPLSEKIVAYGTKTILAVTNRSGVATALGAVAFRCTTGRENLSLPEPP
jgi:hypothetical protein